MSALRFPDEVDQVLGMDRPGGTIYLVGAGGCGMSGLGHLLLDLGFEVEGSDLQVNEEVRQLQARGARIHRGHAEDRVERTTRLVVYTSAVGPDHPELRAADVLGVPIVRRAVLLAALVHRQQGVCIAGMHGKTTTTALLAFALEQLGLQPSYAVGALVPQLYPHARYVLRAGSPGPERGSLFAVEADESDGTLGHFRPRHAIILNVDAEHLDHFADLAAIIAEFRRFADQTSGQVIFCADDPRLAELLARHGRAVSYGRHPLATYRAEVQTPPDHPLLPSNSKPARLPWPLSRFQVWHQGESIGSFQIQLLGDQNISNATAVIAFLHKLGIAPSEIARAIASFRGAARRQQRLYEDGDCAVFEDYGHHPNEIRVTLRSLRNLHPSRLLVVFQPHRYSRTRFLWREFVSCFHDADLLWLADLYPASEPEIAGINSGFLAEAIRAQGQAVEGVGSLAQLRAVILAAIRPGDLILFLGAGDITHLAQDVAKDLRNRVPVDGSSSDAAPVHGDRNVLADMKPELFRELSARLAPETILRPDEPLARRTTLRVGGVADWYAEPASEADLGVLLKFCQSHAVPFMMLGRGSNLLIRDGGVRGLVICLAHPSFSQIQVRPPQLQCGAGARLKAVAVEARRHGLAGFEFLEGIPGSVGGAMRMNAGAMGSWLFDIVNTIRFMDWNGEVHERRASEVNVEYRGCPLFKDHIALGATLQGQPAAAEAIQARMESFSRKRWDSQPNQPSAGCIFKNPGSVPAGRLIDELGLKGTRVGGAVVSDVHANFIVNDGTATARDVLNLIEVIKERARTSRGVELETEVQILGEG
ncbi:MAG: UDP-N-acetylmuramate--L-alanine ligase [Verrucomicrobiota bacterium]